MWNNEKGSVDRDGGALDGGLFLIYLSSTCYILLYICDMQCIEFRCVLRRYPVSRLPALDTSNAQYRTNITHAVNLIRHRTPTLISTSCPRFLLNLPSSPTPGFVIYVAGGRAWVTFQTSHAAEAAYTVKKCS